MSDYELVYFSHVKLGRQYPMQVLAAALGKTFKLTQIEYKDWPNKKASGFFPYDQMPILVLPNGKKLAHTVNILEYLRKQWGMVYDDDFQEAQVMELVLAFEDVLNLFSPVIHAKNEEEKKNLANDINNGCNLFNLINKRVLENGSTGYSVGNKITLADVYVTWVHDIMTVKSSHLKYVNSELFTNCKGLM